jgi:hypothetical protein
VDRFGACWASVGRWRLAGWASVGRWRYAGRGFVAGCSGIAGTALHSSGFVGKRFDAERGERVLSAIAAAGAGNIFKRFPVYFGRRRRERAPHRIAAANRRGDSSTDWRRVGFGLAWEWGRCSKGKKKLRYSSVVYGAGLDALWRSPWPTAVILWRAAACTEKG